VQKKKKKEANYFLIFLKEKDIKLPVSKTRTQSYPQKAINYLKQKFAVCRPNQIFSQKSHTHIITCESNNRKIIDIFAFV